MLRRNRWNSWQTWVQYVLAYVVPITCFVDADEAEDLWTTFRGSPSPLVHQTKMVRGKVARPVAWFYAPMYSVIRYEYIVCCTCIHSECAVQERGLARWMLTDPQDPCSLGTGREPGIRRGLLSAPRRGPCRPRPFTSRQSKTLASDRTLEILVMCWCAS